MAYNLVQKILRQKSVAGCVVVGEQIEISIDQILLHDIAGPMAMMEFEAMGLDWVKVKQAVVYIDHNNLQTGFENMDDHLFLESASQKYGLYLSRAGNGICHQVNLERFSIPGDVLLGVDSHTTNAGGAGMFAFSAGGLDIAAAMSGYPFSMVMPKVVKVELRNQLPRWSSAKDVIFEILRRIGVAGGRGKVLEFAGDGLIGLSLTERATIANMCTETGAVCGIFPSDEVTREYFQAQGREADWSPWVADQDASYDDTIVIDLASLEPLTAAPHSPGNVVPVHDVEGLKIHQVAIGSCTNSSMLDMLKVAEILKGRVIAPNVSLVVTPGSRQVLLELIKTGAITDMVKAGARILESTCGPCMGVGQVPGSGTISLRTFNRNFRGRCGTNDAKVYLVSPETAAVSALTGCLTDPRSFGEPPRVTHPAKFHVDDALLVKPEEYRFEGEIVRGPNIKPLPSFEPLPKQLNTSVLIVLGDNVATDDILPSGPKTAALRSNIPALSAFVFSNLDPNFFSRASRAEHGIIVGGENYGQGSSREHAALAPRYLGIRVVVAQSFARVHRSNLINFGIIPLMFDDHGDVKYFSVGDEIILPAVCEEICEKEIVTINNLRISKAISVRALFTEKEKAILLAGGLLPYIKWSVLAAAKGNLGQKIH